MKERLSNIELLRIISMLMIITLHLLLFGGMLREHDDFSYKSIFVWTMESLCFVAVNCYVIISGYFLIDSKFKFKKIFNIWVEVLFYSLVIYFILLLTNQIEFSYNSLLKSILPFSLKNYWFVTVYIMLYILSPFMNKLINVLNKKQYAYLILIILIFFSLWGTIINPSDTINYGGSYSISWFICLYFIAGYLKRFYSGKLEKKRVSLLVYLVLSVINALVYFAIKWLDITLVIPDFLYYYYSITVVIASISLFMFFKNLKIKNKFLINAINFFAPTTFAAYLIHENPNIRDVLWQKFYFVGKQGTIKMIVLVFAIPIVLLILFGLIDKIRLIIFKVIGKLNLNKKNISLKIFKEVEKNLCQK